MRRWGSSFRTSVPLERNLTPSPTRKKDRPETGLQRESRGPNQTFGGTQTRWPRREISVELGVSDTDRDLTEKNHDKILLSAGNAILQQRVLV